MNVSSSGSRDLSSASSGLKTTYPKRVNAMTERPDSGSNAPIDIMPRCSWPIVWIEKAMGIKPEGKREVRLSVGVCGYSGQAAFFSAGGVMMMLYQDVSVHGGRCYDDKWCLNLKCPLNKTDHLTYRKGSSFAHEDMTREEFSRLVEHRDWIENSLRETGWYDDHSIEHSGVYGAARGVRRSE